MSNKLLDKIKEMGIGLSIIYIGSPTSISCKCLILISPRWICIDYLVFFIWKNSLKTQYLLSLHSISFLEAPVLGPDANLTLQQGQNIPSYLRKTSQTEHLLQLSLYLEPLYLFWVILCFRQVPWQEKVIISSVLQI